MASINKTEFKVLELNGKNYQTWALDCEFHLQARLPRSPSLQPMFLLRHTMTRQKLASS